MGTEEIDPFLKCSKVQFYLVSSRTKCLLGISHGQITVLPEFSITSVLEMWEGINVKAEL